jgi:ferredoxin
MTILYFTSTGNNLMVAKSIGGKLISIPQIMRKENYQFEDDTIGLIFPVFGLCVPPFIVEFLDKARFSCGYLFAVITYGTYAGGAVSQLVNLAQKHRINFNYINRLHMQENYLPGFAMEKQKKPTAQDKQLAKIKQDIDCKLSYIKHDTAFDNFMTWTHQKSYRYERGVGLSNKFTTTDQCVGCGICAQVCPTKNVHLAAGKPVFTQDCISCMACIQNCPSNAIHLSTEKSAIRYRNPQITLDEIIQSNR